MTRPLYIQAQSSMRVLRDGPALRVRQEQQADRLYPLARLSRIVVRGMPEWDTAALLACAEAGISIVFIGGDGSVRATVAGPGSRRPLQSVDLLLAELCEQPKRVECYRDWIDALSRQAWTRLIRRAGQPQSITSSEVRNMIINLIATHARTQDVRDFTNTVQGLLRAAVSARLIAVGFDIDMPALTASKVKIVEDLSLILSWPLLHKQIPYLRRLARAAVRSGRAKPRIATADAVRFFELHAEQVTEGVDSLLHRLHIHLLDVLKANV